MGAEETRTAILDAARKLFAEKGYGGATMAQIAHRVGITDAAIYRHFRDKRELFVACATRQLTTSRPSVEEFRQAKDLRSMMRMVLQTRLALMQANRDLFDIFFREAHNFPEVLEVMLRRLEPTPDEMPELVARVRAGLRRPLNVPIMGIGLWGLIWTIVRFKLDAKQIEAIAPDIPWSHNDLLDDLTDFVMYGLAGEPPAGKQEVFP